MSLLCCARCYRPVCKDDRIHAIGKAWHSFCFSCYHCNQALNEYNFRHHSGELFCRCCWKLLFDCCNSVELIKQKPCFAPHCNMCSMGMPKPGCRKPPNMYCLKPTISRKCFIPCIPNNPCAGSRPCTPTKPCGSCVPKPNTPCKVNRTCDSCGGCFDSCLKLCEPVCDHCSPPCKPFDGCASYDPCGRCCPMPCSAPKRCPENPMNCCSGLPPPCPGVPLRCPVPRETACFYSRNHKRCGPQRAPSCPHRKPPCRTVCGSPCPLSHDSCQSCDDGPPSCLPACGSDSECEFCTSRCIYYPPINRCEPIPSEIICLESGPIELPQKCCYTPTRLPFCNTCKSCQGVASCRRCGQKVYKFEKICAAGGVYHTCCFTCYCCGLQLDVTNRYESCGEIYCKGCYQKGFWCWKVRLLAQHEENTKFTLYTTLKKS